MAQIIIPGKWMQQPQGPVEVNKEFDTRLLYIPSIANINLANNTKHVGSSPYFKTSTKGTSLYSETFNGWFDFPLTTTLKTSNSQSISIVAYINYKYSTSSFQTILSTSYDFSKSIDYYLDIRTGGALQVGSYGTNNSYANTGIGGGLIDNKDTLIVAGIDAGNTIQKWRIYINNNFALSSNVDTAINSWASNTKVSVGRVADGINGRIFSGHIYLAAVIFESPIVVASKLGLNPWGLVKPIKRQFWSEAPNLLSPRYSRPYLDISNSGWSASSGSDLYAMIDEETPSDTDYIFATTSGSTYEAKLQPVTDPNTAINQIIKYRTRSLYNNTLIAKLKQGSTVIATRTHTNVPSEWTTYSMVLSESEANAITDYTDLRIHTEIA